MAIFRQLTSSFPVSKAYVERRMKKWLGLSFAGALWMVLVYLQQVIAPCEGTPHEHVRNDRVCNSDDPHQRGLTRDVGLGVGAMGKTSKTQNHAFSSIASGLHFYDGLRHFGGFMSRVRSLSPQSALCDLLSLAFQNV